MARPVRALWCPTLTFSSRRAFARRIRSAALAAPALDRRDVATGVHSGTHGDFHDPDRSLSLREALELTRRDLWPCLTDVGVGVAGRIALR